MFNVGEISTFNGLCVSMTDLPSKATTDNIVIIIDLNYICAKKKFIKL